MVYNIPHLSVAFDVQLVGNHCGAAARACPSRNGTSSLVGTAPSPGLFQKVASSPTHRVDKALPQLPGPPCTVCDEKTKTSPGCKSNVWKVHLFGCASMSGKGGKEVPRYGVPSQKCCGLCNGQVFDAVTNCNPWSALTGSSGTKTLATCVPFTRQ